MHSEKTEKKYKNRTGGGCGSPLRRPENSICGGDKTREKEECFLSPTLLFVLNRRLKCMTSSINKKIKIKNKYKSLTVISIHGLVLIREIRV